MRYPTNGCEDKIGAEGFVCTFIPQGCLAHYSQHKTLYHAPERRLSNRGHPEPCWTWRVSSGWRDSNYVGTDVPAAPQQIAIKSPDSPQRTSTSCSNPVLLRQAPTLLDLGPRRLAVGLASTFFGIALLEAYLRIPSILKRTREMFELLELLRLRSLSRSDLGFGGHPEKVL